MQNVTCSFKTLTVNVRHLNHGLNNVRILNALLSFKHTNHRCPSHVQLFPSLSRSLHTTPYMCFHHSQVHRRRGGKKLMPG